MTQYSLFGAATAAASLDDLDGVLLAGGHWVRGARAGGGSPGARLSVVVADRWRADALAAAFAERDVGPAEVGESHTGHSVRTAFVEALVPHAERWTRGAGEYPPPGLALTPSGLRLWAITAGRSDETGYLFATAAPDDPVHIAGGAQLARLGVAAVSLSARGRTGWRVTSMKRLRRLAEMLGEPPPGAQWPS